MKTPRKGRSSPAIVEVGLEARDLPAVGVPVDHEVGETQMGPVDEDHAGAGAEDRPVERADRLVEPVQRRELRDRRRFPARDDEPVEPVELLRQSHLDHVRPRSPEGASMLPERALERKNADPRPPVHRFQV